MVDSGSTINVYSGKGDIALARDLLRAGRYPPHARALPDCPGDARHPALLYYLDNCLTRDGLSSAPSAGRRMGPTRTMRANCSSFKPGVDGAARRTWGEGALPHGQHRSSSAEGRFVFRPAAHDPGAKTVLGAIPAGGGESTA
jgi:hypothetical protein